MGKVFVFEHPLMHHKLSIIRDEQTNTKLFREVIDEIGMLMAYEVTKNLPTENVIVKTPITEAKCKKLKNDVVIVPILRAGIGMVDGLTAVIPQAKVGHIGLARDEKTLQPQEYYVKFPDSITESTVILVDPMLATGGSVSYAIKLLKNRGIKDIIYAGIVGAPEGVKRIKKDHPDVDIYLAALDDKLNEVGYIVPGLGDCGDRLFGTKK